MTATHPVDQLMSEHRIIESVLTAMEQTLATMTPAKFPAEFFEDALDFFRNFADGYHHYKEEDALFPALKARGIPEEGGPIGCMLKEHVFGRSCLAGIRENLAAARGGSAEAVEAIRGCAHDYINMLRPHIVKEDTVLYRMARHVLEQPDVERLERDYANPDNPRITAAVRAKYEALAAKLAAVTAPAQCLPGR
ncbi:MAG: hemerythrin domain-containing protein [Acidobacteria bacterium]|nr:hemerythrin domain-containing protein [Acidobacteriota bacterium]